MSDAFVGVERLRLANEGAIKANIQQLIDALVVQAATNPAMQPASPPTDTPTS